MKGYKAFDDRLRCGLYVMGPGMQYEVGGTYRHQGDIQLCRSGFHFCREMWEVYKWYPSSFTTRVCEVEATGRVLTTRLGDKSVTDEITIVRELSPEEILDGLCRDHERLSRRRLPDHERGPADWTRIVVTLWDILVSIHDVGVHVKVAAEAMSVPVASEAPPVVAPVVAPPKSWAVERMEEWEAAVDSHENHPLVAHAVKLAGRSIRLRETYVPLLR